MDLGFRIRNKRKLVILGFRITRHNDVRSLKLDDFQLSAIVLFFVHIDAHPFRLVRLIGIGVVGNSSLYAADGNCAACTAGARAD